MDIKKLDPITKLIPTISKPKNPPSQKMRFAYSLIIIAGFMVLMNIPIYGLFNQQISSSNLFVYMLDPNLYSIARIGIFPLLISILMIDVVSAKFIRAKIDTEADKERLRKIEMLISIILAILIAIGATISYMLPQGNIIIFIELLIGFLIILYVDDISRMYAATNGVNLFILSEFALLIIYGLIFGIIPELSVITFGNTNTLSYITLNFLPFIMQILIIAISFFAYDRFIKPSVKIQTKINGEDEGIPFLYIGPLALVTSLTLLNFLAFVLTPPSFYPNVAPQQIFLSLPPPFYPQIGLSYSTFFSATFFSTMPVSIPFLNTTYSLPPYMTDIILGIELIVLTLVFTLVWRSLLSREANQDKNALKSEDKTIIKSSMPLVLLYMLSVFLGIVGNLWIDNKRHNTCNNIRPKPLVHQ